MNTVSLLTPPMDTSEPLPEEKQPGYFKQWQELPPLNPYEQERIGMLSSLSFDEFYMHWPAELNYEVKIFLAKARQYLDRYVNQMKCVYKKHKFKTIERRIFYGMAKQCHVVLLANDWTGALELYQEVLSYNQDLFSRDPAMYFGLGLIYFHFREWEAAIVAFTRLLYNFPTGRIALEVKVRLGMCYMELDDYPRALMLFQLAVNDGEESKCMPRLIIRYNIALSHENFGELEIAEKEYEKLTTDLDNYITNHGTSMDNSMINLLSKVRTSCYRQLGWIYYRRYYADPNHPDALKKAHEQLSYALELSPDDGHSYYYMGRILVEESNLAGAGPRDAFKNYHSSIEKAEQKADQWCAIGTLYMSQNQAMDALQSFICAVELDKTHTAAWTNLGELYARNLQFQDALDCYKNAQKNNPHAPDPIKERVDFLEKELSMPIPTRPPNHVIPGIFEAPIPSLKDAYSQPIPSELRTRLENAYDHREARFDNALWSLWANVRTMEQDNPEGMYLEVPNPRPMEDLEILVMQLLRDNEPSLVKAEREVLECLETSEALFKANIIEYVVPEAGREMPRVTEEMIQNLRDHGHLLESPRCYSFPFLPKIAFTDIPDNFSLISELYVSLDISAQEIMQMAGKRSQPNTTYLPVFEEFAKPPEPPKGPKKVAATEREIKRALEKNERHPLLLKTTILTVDNRKEAHSVELQRYLDGSTISCIRGLTSCLRLDLSLFSTKAVTEADGGQEIEVRTQYQLPPETNCDHASQPTWKCISEQTYTTLSNYAQYQTELFKHTLKADVEKFRKTGGNGRGPSPKRQKLQKRARSPPKDLKRIKFGTNIDLSDDNKWGKQINELSKLPAFCRLIAGSNMLSHLGHQIQGMNTVQLSMNVPGSRTTARQENNHVASVNINIGPGDCEWFAVPYEYWGKMEKMCEQRKISFSSGTYWPIMNDLLEAGIPVHRFTQKAGDIVYVNGGAIHWKQATGWGNSISWNVAPLNCQQLTTSLLSYEYNKLRRIKSDVPVQLMCWQVAKNVKFTNQLIYNTCKGILIRSLAFLKMVHDYLVANKKTIKTHARTSGEQSHYCMTCECEVFNILLIKELAGKFTVFCVYCAKSQGIEDFIAIQQFSFPDLMNIYENMKYTPAALNSKMSFTA